MKRKILVVDDKVEFLRLLKSFLSLKYEVAVADNISFALSLLKGGFVPDVIVSDLVMPEAGGKVLIRQLKSSELYKNIPIIILSNIDTSTEKVEVLKLGASDYLTKPFNPEELEVRIQKLI